jgi:N-acetylneuraminic acid mutarotase
MRKKTERIAITIGIIIISALSVGLFLGITIIQNQTPPARDGFGMIYDPQLQKSIIFGGINEDGSEYEVFEDLWTYDSAANIWNEIVPTNKPSARSGHAMVYDSINHKTILFGGWDEIFRSHQDTWVYDSQANQWIDVIPNTSPEERVSHSMCYDPVSQKVILFGGYKDVGPHFNDTWEYDYNLNTWTELNPSNSPSGRYGTQMVYDPINQRIVLFGGHSTSILDDTWIYYYENNTWTELNTTGSPDTRYWHGMVYDSHNHKIVIFGGRHEGAPGDAIDDTWIFNPSNNHWTEVLPSNHPSNRMYYSEEFDSPEVHLEIHGYTPIAVLVGVL